MMTGGGDEAADDQVRAIAIILNSVLYTGVGLLIWLFLLRRRAG